MKKFIIIFISILLTVTIVEKVYVSYKCRDINYAVKNYFTTGIFNKYKLCNMGDINMYFSNGTVAFIKVSGMSTKMPHEKLEYTVFIQKNARGVWKIKKVYPAQITLK
ncbi:MULTISPECIES: hypothetical protein [Clostridium]|uniref:Uncharacterized protein n=4 Tax=Clostridium TaxID=1485 RepID=D8GN66_CLOLD|nr:MULTISPECIES: hypothetical protein [Clostridium]ADK13690.1 conserved hypothetical protein [Clostridium ljungdahlii DSM 13528]AGY76914.1 hypothetical protein CAETHG_2707 [Clostridium autoethanogenum DSM 10061]ALU37060.1 Hypothetical protein CLAU_2632 [Clostridium autoethanogenum DSM 10061]OAA84483.1 hypothetical protein WX45_00951 [Clostridium ljungdahlii DSM 13528]OAA92816.1 hypothetical protein WX73_00700 [Clostridium coskatii]